MKFLQKSGVVVGMIFLMSLILPMSAGAQSTTEPVPNPRYAITKTENGFVRVDNKTGDLSFCSLQEGKLTCRLAADERAAHQSGIDAMSERLATLEARLKMLESKTPKVESTNRKSILPNDEELDQALKFANKAMRRLFGLVKELKQDIESGKI